MFFYTKTLVLPAAFTITLFIFQLPQICKAMESTQTCTTRSSCGRTAEIRYPFRLDTDSSNCGDPRYQLACDENNRTVLHLFSRKFYVEDIFYDNFSMRVVDPGIRKDDCSSLPLQPLSPSDFKTHDAYTLKPFLSNGNFYEDVHEDNKRPLIPYGVITLVSCPVGVAVDSTIFVDSAASCDDKGKAPFPFATSSLLPARSYAVHGRFRGSDVKDTCVIGVTTLVSNHWLDLNFTNFQSLHDGMAYGFELMWFHYHSNCTKCRKSGRRCYLKNNNQVGCANRCGLPDWVYTSRILSSPPNLSTIMFIYCYGYDPSVAILYVGYRIAMAALCGFPCMSFFLIRKWRRRHLSIYDNIEEFLQSQNNFMPIRYSYSQLRKITKQFKDKIGEGGYGSVYRGKLRSATDVAVKMLDISKGNGQDFINEVATIGRIHHANVVRLIGFCVENSKRALVYDFLSNGSLEKHIFSKESNVSITWEKMHEIALGIARGIEYLHGGCDIQILHFDIKPHNILLDDHLAPQISDFGLAKLCAANDDIVPLTAARGTFGYMAPEMFYKNIGVVSNKADVYSFGMMLMEMTARRKNLNVSAENLTEVYFPTWVYEQLSEGKGLGIGNAEDQSETVKKMIIVALWCIQMKPTDRPSINRVIEMLEGNVENLSMPPKPFLSPSQIPHQSIPSKRPMVSGM